MDITADDCAQLGWDISSLLSSNRGEYPSIDDLDVNADDVAACLPAFIAALDAAANRRRNPDPHADAPRNQDGTFKHTCNGDVLSGLPFGKLAPAGECARCDERRDGAAPRLRFGGRLTRAERDEIVSAENAAHFASVKHRTGGCGLVCTYGEW